MPGDKCPVVFVGVPLILDISELTVETNTLDHAGTKLFGGPIFDEHLLLWIMNCHKHVQATKLAKLHCFLYKPSLALLVSIHSVILVSYEVSVAFILPNHYNNLNN